MSDLTITTAGQSESKVSGGEFLSSEKKLNQMKVVLTDAVTPTVFAGATVANDLLFNPVKIPNAVGVKGGTGVVQSVVVSNDSGHTLPFDIVLTSSPSIVALGALGDPISGLTGQADIIIQETLGVISVPTLIDVGTCAVGSSDNLGLVIKAPSDSRDVYMYGIARGAATTVADDYHIRFGLIQD